MQSCEIRCYGIWCDNLTIISRYRAYELLMATMFTTSLLLLLLLRLLFFCQVAWNEWMNGESYRRPYRSACNIHSILDRDINGFMYSHRFRFQMIRLKWARTTRFNSTQKDHFEWPDTFIKSIQYPFKWIYSLICWSYREFWPSNAWIDDRND